MLDMRPLSPASGHISVPSVPALPKRPAGAANYGCGTFTLLPRSSVLAAALVVSAIPVSPLPQAALVAVMGATVRRSLFKNLNRWRIPAASCSSARRTPVFAAPY